ncbi:MAG: hypothetical protein H6837_16725 [Planctomycetes bacterium]|nr:hypothetical protein [Planctomycetota bacterium]
MANRITSKLDALNRQLRELEAERRSVQAKLGKVAAIANAWGAWIPRHLAAELDLNARKAAEVYSGVNPAVYADWEGRAWDSWEPDASRLTSRIELGELSYLRAGRLVEGKGALAALRVADAARGFSCPAMVPFIGKGQAVVILHNKATETAALALLQSMLLRVYAALPHHSHFTLLDPVGLGQAFPMQGRLPRKTEVRSDPSEALSRVVENIRSIRASVLGYTEGFHLLPEETLSTQPFEFVFVAGFPRGYATRAVEMLLNVGMSGPAAGRYPFIMMDEDQAWPHGTSIDLLEHRHVIDLTKPHERFEGFRFEPDEPPSPSVQLGLFEAASRATSKRTFHTFEQHGDLSRDAWWTANATNGVRATIGRGDQDIEVFFGVDDAGVPCVHGMMAGMPGSGKSNLYHIILLELATRYAPDELQLYLIDGKKGTEFQFYKDLPHAGVVSLRTSPEMVCGLLDELIREMGRRNGLFLDRGVSSYQAFRESGESLPRIVLLWDEYQEVFEDEKLQQPASEMVKRLAQQGRSAGIHMLLGSQSFGASGMLYQAEIFNNTHMRVAMKLAAATAQTLTEFGPQGRRAIQAFGDAPGHVLVNDRAGADEGNRTGRVFLLDDGQPARRVAELAEKEGEWGGAVSQKVVLDGSGQPPLSTNWALTEVSRQQRCLGGGELEELARRPASMGGLGCASWSASQRPIGLCLGQEYAVWKHAMLVFRRRIGQHAIVVGADASARQGMVAAMMVSAAILHAPTELSIVVVDQMTPGSDGGQILEQTLELLRCARGTGVTRVCDPDAAAETIVSLHAENREREATSTQDVERPTTLLVLVEGERVPMLRRTGGRPSGSPHPAANALESLMGAGAEAGTHLLVVSSGLRSVGQIVDVRRELAYFNHRVALQMSEDDSYAFVGSRAASQLQRGGARPVSALYVDAEAGGKGVKLRPYDASSIRGFLEQHANLS